MPPFRTKEIVKFSSVDRSSWITQYGILKLSPPGWSVAILAPCAAEVTKHAAGRNLTSASGQWTYDHAIREFVAWYCSEPRLAFNRTVVRR